MAESSIIIERRRGYVGSASAFRVMIDDGESGEVWPGDEVTIPIGTGAHEVYVTTDGRVRSTGRTVDLAPGERARVLCACPRNPAANLWKIAFRPADVLSIEIASQASAER